MTEKAAEEKLEELQTNEEDELIEFAKSLDFDKYINDMEVQSMIEKLHSRVQQLEKEVAQEELKEKQEDEHSQEKALARIEMLKMMVSGFLPSVCVLFLLLCRLMYSDLCRLCHIRYSH